MVYTCHGSSYRARSIYKRYHTWPDPLPFHIPQPGSQSSRHRATYQPRHPRPHLLATLSPKSGRFPQSPRGHFPLRPSATTPSRHRRRRTPLVVASSRAQSNLDIMGRFSPCACQFGPKYPRGIIVSIPNGRSLAAESHGCSARNELADAWALHCCY